ncbi:Protein of unknown function D [Prunus dulcis]|uniref:Uncharacterized protein n=1 Tax=Prunus dulcis TaxID=3755 RepID=A0A4Y1RZD4_PRUDU|nr:Protein of unknown function D [Prunus dulcis]
MQHHDLLDKIGSFKKANNLYEDRILEGRPSLEKSQIDFSEMEDCLVSSGSVLLGTKLLSFSLNSVIRGDVIEFC